MKKFLFGIKRESHPCTFRSLENDVQTKTTTNVSEVVDNDVSDDDSEEEESLGKVVTKAGKEIDRKSAGNVKRSKDEAQADPEPENEFGYTESMFRFLLLFFGFIHSIACGIHENNWCLIFSTLLNYHNKHGIEKIKKRYGNLGNIVRVNIIRSNNSMGIALAGHRNRNEMGCFVAGLNPKGTASTQNVQVGDEILEVIFSYYGG